MVPAGGRYGKERWGGCLGTQDQESMLVSLGFGRVPTHRSSQGDIPRGPQGGRACPVHRLQEEGRRTGERSRGVMEGPRRRPSKRPSKKDDSLIEAVRGNLEVTRRPYFFRFRPRAVISGEGPSISRYAAHLRPSAWMLTMGSSLRAGDQWATTGHLGLLRSWPTPESRCPRTPSQYGCEVWVSVGSSHGVSRRSPLALPRRQLPRRLPRPAPRSRRVRPGIGVGHLLHAHRRGTCQTLCDS